MRVQANHRGHGPQYLWNSTIEGKSVAENFRLGPELEKASREASNYRRFLELSKELVEVNEKICRRGPYERWRMKKSLRISKKTAEVIRAEIDQEVKRMVGRLFEETLNRPIAEQTATGRAA